MARWGDVSVEDVVSVVDAGRSARVDVAGHYGKGVHKAILFRYDTETFEVEDHLENVFTGHDATEAVAAYNQIQAR